MKAINIQKRFLVTALAGATLMAGEAMAQLEEIIVTAQKRQESMQDVPVAITAISGDAIAKQNITSLAGLNNSLPNVQINQWANSPDSAIFTIRGIGVNDSDPYVGTTVSVVVDGVVVGVNTAALISLFDIERVEVLRGPQGTLFGANTTGGVVNVVTKQPTGEFGGEGQISSGNHGRVDANVAVNFPLTDNLSGKVSVLHTSHDGYFTNLVNGSDLGKSDITSLRGYLRYDQDAYDATLIGEYVRTRNGSQTNLNVGNEDMVLYVPGEVGLKPRYRRGHSPGLPDQNHRDTYGLTLTQNWSGGPGDWVSITSYREYDHDLYSDDDATTLQLLQTRRQTDHWQFSQEIRNRFEVTDSVEMTVGGFYFRQAYELDQEGVLDGFLPGMGQPQTQDQENWSASAFSQLYWDISENLRFQAGLRYTHEETDATSTTALTFSPGPGIPASFQDPIAPGTLVVAKGKDEWDEIGYKFGLDYRLSDSSMIYGYYARGFKSGGFTGRIAVAEDIGPFDPEYLDTIEVGFKSDLLGDRVRVNLAAFYNEYEDMQVTQNITYPNGANSASITNAGGASSQGAELEVTAYPLDNLMLSLAVAYLDSEYKDYDTRSLDPELGELVDVSYKGNPLMNAPRWSGNISMNYSLPLLGGNTDFFLQTTHSAPKFSNYTAFPQERIAEITLVNAKVSWTPADERWSVGVYGRNLADKHYISQVLWSAPGFTSGGMGAPREVGLDFSFNW